MANVCAELVGGGDCVYVCICFVFLFTARVYSPQNCSIQSKLIMRTYRYAIIWWCKKHNKRCRGLSIWTFWVFFFDFVSLSCDSFFSFTLFPEYIILACSYITLSRFKNSLKSWFLIKIYHAWAIVSECSFAPCTRASYKLVAMSKIVLIV